MRNKIMRKLSIIFCAFFSLQANKSNAKNNSVKYLHKFAPKSDKIKIYKKLGIAAGVTTTVAIGGLLGSYAYKNSDNVFQRKLIGSSDKIREINADDLTNINMLYFIPAAEVQILFRYPMLPKNTSGKVQL